METNNVELITRMVLDALNKKEEKGNGFMVPIGVSARHIHLTQEHVEALFGPGYQLTKKKELMGGQFASNVELAEAAHNRGIPLLVDFGSGSLVDIAFYGIEPEKTVQELLKKGADIVSFSGDKLCLLYTSPSPRD